MGRQVGQQGDEAEVLAVEVEEFGVGQTIFQGAAHPQHTLVS